MDDHNITMEEYIQLMADKARGRDKTFNWETDTYGKVYCDDLDSFTDFETDFPAIVYNDASTSNQNVFSEPTVSIYNAIKADIDFHISFSDSEDEDFTFIYNKDSSSYKLIPINDLKPEPAKDKSTVVNTTQACCSMCFKKVPRNGMTKDRWRRGGGGTLGGGDSLEDEEVTLVDGVFEGALGALGYES
ncbi:hypothetical protein Tco_0950454 [Tanacetum coccineum]